MNKIKIVSTDANEKTVSGQENSGSFSENLKTVFLAIFIALIIRSFFFEPFRIPSGSMYPTLRVGDYLFVSKYTYGYSRYSFPAGLPLFEGPAAARRCGGFPPEQQAEHRFY